MRPDRSCSENYILKECVMKSAGLSCESLYLHVSFFFFFNLGVLDAQLPTEMHFSLITTVPGGLRHSHQALWGSLTAEVRSQSHGNWLPSAHCLSVHTVKMMLNVLVIIPPSPAFKEQPEHPVQPHHFPCSKVSFPQALFQSHLLEAPSNCILC